MNPGDWLAQLSCTSRWHRYWFDTGLVLFDTRRPEWRPLFNPINALVYNADDRSVHTVIVAGHVVVEDHSPCYMDEWELVRQVQTLGERLLL